MEGWFRLWAEDPSAAPGRRFCSGRSTSGRPAFDTRSSRSTYRSFSVKHNEETKHTYLALLSNDGRLSIYETDQPEGLSDYASIDEFVICNKPQRGEEVSFKVRFDPNPEPCYTALRAGVPTDALGLVAAGMDTVKVYRSRDIVTSSYGVDSAQKEFYLAVEITGHRGLVRELAWAPGNIRGYDIIATACQDGYARVFRLETPFSDDDGKSWSEADLLTNEKHAVRNSSPTKEEEKLHQQAHPSTLSASLAKTAGAQIERQWQGQPGQIEHTVREISKLDNHRTPVWRVGFDVDGQILGTTGDDGKLLCYRQAPDGTWLKSSEMVMMKSRMAAP